MSDISKRIMWAIQHKDITYVQLAKRTGYPKSALQRYATGQTDRVPIDRLRAIADVCGVSAAWLMGWVQDPFDKTPIATDKAPAMQLTQGEASLIREFRRMTDDEKLMVLKLVRGIQISRTEELKK